MSCGCSNQTFNLDGRESYGPLAGRECPVTISGTFAVGTILSVACGNHGWDNRYNFSVVKCESNNTWSVVEIIPGGYYDQDRNNSHPWAKTPCGNQKLFNASNSSYIWWGCYLTKDWSFSKESPEWFSSIQEYPVDNVTIDTCNVCPSSQNKMCKFTSGHVYLDENWTWQTEVIGNYLVCRE